MKPHFATALTLVSAQTIVRLATRANIGLANLYFKRRNEGRDKLKLPDRTDIFAEARPAKNRIDDKSREKIVND